MGERTTRRFEAEGRRPAGAAWLGAALLLAAGATLGGCATSPARPAADVAAAGRRALEDACGIRVEALRLSAAGTMLDFRYRVTDPEKAAPLLDGRQRPFLTDARGAKLGVPDTPILGSLRQTGRNGKVSPHHTYFILFANPARYLHPGDRVTLVVGEARLPGLAVE